VARMMVQVSPPRWKSDPESWEPVLRLVRAYLSAGGRAASPAGEIPATRLEEWGLQLDAVRAWVRLQIHRAKVSAPWLCQPPARPHAEPDPTWPLYQLQLFAPSALRSGWWLSAAALATMRLGALIGRWE
jgi:hypothetical protein